MNKTIYTIKDFFIWFLTYFFLISLNLFATESWGFLVLLALTVAILVLSDFKLNIGVFHKRTFSFFVFCLLSVFWALNYHVTITRSITILEVLICMSVLYDYYLKTGNYEILLKIFMYAGYTVLIYSYVFFGLDNMIVIARSGERLGHAYTNVNNIGMFAAYAVIVDVFLCLKNKLRWTLLLAIPTIFLVSVTQSRKALFMLVAGPFILYVIKNGKNITKDLRPLLKICLGVVVLGFLVSLFTEADLFSGMTNRVMSMIRGLQGSDDTDFSTKYRLEMIRIGLNQFKQTPLLGVGMGNSDIVVYREMGNAVYLHNNYVELLCCGGIIGFLLYYSIYFSLFKGLWPYRKANPYVLLVLVLMVINLFTDYGAVAYYSKMTYFRFMMFYVLMEQCRVKYARKKKYPYMSIKTKGNEVQNTNMAIQQQ